MESRDPMSAIVRNLNPYKRVQGTRQVEHFFPDLAGLNVHKADIKRYYDFVDRKVSDLPLVAPPASIANGQDKVDYRLSP